MDVTAVVVIFLGKYAIGLIALAFAFFLWKLPEDCRVNVAVLAIFSLGAVYGFARLLGALYSHPQPFFELGFEPLIPHAVDNAFPSDHTALGGVLASVALFHKKMFGLWLWAGVLLIGLARIFAGLHYGSDVLVAAALALAVVYVFKFSYARITRAR